MNGLDANRCRAMYGWCASARGNEASKLVSRTGTQDAPLTNDTKENRRAL